MMEIKYLFLLVLLEPVYTQLISPCPDLFEYESQGENGQWNGTLTVLSKSELNGIWLRLVFDKPVLQLANWFGEIERREGNDILIKKPGFKLAPNRPYKIKFIVKYGENEEPPRLESFRLNAVTICPDQGGVTEEAATSGQLITSSILSTTSRPQENSLIPNINKETEHFPGDFTVIAGKKPDSSSRPSNNANRNTACGTIPLAPAPLITFGQTTSPGQWPWHAAIYYSEPVGIRVQYTCGATLISEDHLLTAAHCVTKPRTNRPLDLKSLVIYLGKHDLRKFGNGVQDREVSEISVHPDYNHTVFFNDIAVLTLKDPADITNYVRPCCLWEGDDSSESLVDRLGTVVGWGFDEKRVVSDTLVQTQMPVVEKTKCIYSNPNFFSVFTNENNFCAGFRNGTTVCNGDSGGGMVFPKVGTTGRDTVWQIRGIVSLSVALQDQAICDPEHYAIFTDVTKYLRWIKRIMNK